MSSTTTTKPSLSLKLLIDTDQNRVLFAEAGKDFVDFLFSLMSLPIATVIGLLSADEMAGSLGKVYQSVENLSDTYLQPKANKTALLNPNAVSLAGVGIAELVTLPSNTPAAKTIYRCSNCWFDYVTYDPNDVCASCSRKMSLALTFVQPKASPAAPAVGGGGGYVKDAVTYMVKDDLEVKPMSTISSIALLKNYGIKEISGLEEVLVSIGIDEGLKLLKVSFESKTVLSDVFLSRESNIGITI